MKILTAKQIKDLDAYTIEHEPISSIDLMERASLAFARKVMNKWGVSTAVKVFAGPGNNGGDALAVARMLSLHGYSVSVFLFNTNDSLSTDCERNLARLNDCDNVDLTVVTSSFTPPVLGGDDLVIDGLFGTGLSRALNGGFASVVKYLNASSATIVSIDVPSGLMCENNEYNVVSHIIRAKYTFTFQFPKLAFFFPENDVFVGKWEVLDIGIVDPENELTESPFHFTEKDDVAMSLKTRSRFAHKGSVGHAALVAGQKGMAGAAILASRACMKTGVGKLTVRTPEYNVLPLQIAVPEVVLSVDPDVCCFSKPFDTLAFDALAMGPGMGTSPATAQAFIEQVSFTKAPIVLDADAINILGAHRGWIAQLPKGSILTPHKKELCGLIGSTNSSYDQLEKTRSLCLRQHIYVVIKGALSAICCPDGSVCFNPTGNPGMATAGSGDVLTGIILSLLAQEYNPDNAVKLGVYLHGLAGDIAAEKNGYEGLLASDIIDGLSEAFRRMREKK